MDQTTLETVGNILIGSAVVMGAGTIVFGTLASAERDTYRSHEKLGNVRDMFKAEEEHKSYVKSAYTSMALMAGCAVAAITVFTNIDDAVLKEEKNLAKQEQILKQKLKQQQEDAMRNKKIQEIRAKGAEFDKQIKALDGVTVVPHRSTYVTFALSAQNARV